MKFGLYGSRGMAYPSPEFLFRPCVAYPEYPFSKKEVSPAQNSVYEGVRRLLALSGLDCENYGTSAWNPLGKYVAPGNRVLIKPNLVMHENLSGMGTDCLYTNPSIIAAIVDYVVIALKGSGSIIVADAPMQSCDFERLASDSGLDKLVAWYRKKGVPIELKDLRGLKMVAEGVNCKQIETENNNGVLVDLGKDSCFYDLDESQIRRLRITNYDPRELRKHHSPVRHEYLVALEMTSADVIINLPKVKTHRKAGITGALKNMVGINVRKEYLPHHTVGAKGESFDEYAKSNGFKRIAGALVDKKNELINSNMGFARLILGIIARGLSIFGKTLSGDYYSEGSWFGNDTIWRTILDLNKIVFFSNASGVMQAQKQRKMIVIGDMVVVGQGEGPLLPRPANFSLLTFSDSPTVHDVASARLLGTDATFIPTVQHSVEYEGAYKWEERGIMDTVCSSNLDEFNGVLVRDLNSDLSLSVEPSLGWAGRFLREAHS